MPIFQFAVFYNTPLEFTTCGAWTVNGPVHANGDIYVGSTQPLVFDGLVTMTGSVIVTNQNGLATTNYTDTGDFRAGKMIVPSPLTLPIGTNNTPDVLREIINQPPAGEDPASPMAQERFYNKAKVVLLVSNSTVTATLKNSPWDPVPVSVTATYYPTNSNPTNYLQVSASFPFLALTNTFTDQREIKVVKATDIDLALLTRWLLTNELVNSKFPNAAGVYDVLNVPNLLYAADNRTNTSSQFTALRLKNAAGIPTNLVSIAGTAQRSGFTVATPNPLYIWGHYNCPNAAHLCTTNTTQTCPAALLSDAFTILSPSWNDAWSAGPYTRRAAAETTINAAIVSGIVCSTGSGPNQFSGGAQNLPRLLEDWYSHSVALTLNTSIVNLFNSIAATNRYVNPGTYYGPPTRHFHFDLNFLDATRLPPGTPLVGSTTPFITTPPQTQAVVGGQDAVFGVLAIGVLPMSYQWQFNGGNIPNATNSTLTITNAGPGDQGSYQVVLTNLAGMVTSPPAALSIYDTAAASLAFPTFSTGGCFRLSLAGVPGFNYIIETSTNLRNWAPLSTNTSPFTSVDGDATHFLARYYRAVCSP